VVERSAVNRLVVGSSPTWGDKSTHLKLFSEKTFSFESVSSEVIELRLKLTFNVPGLEIQLAYPEKRSSQIIRKEKNR
jgi:hypothetical protein